MSNLLWVIVRLLERDLGVGIQLVPDIDVRGSNNQEVAVDLRQGDWVAKVSLDAREIDLNAPDKLADLIRARIVQAKAILLEKVSKDA